MVGHDDVPVQPNVTFISVARIEVNEHLHSAACAKERPTVVRTACEVVSVARQVDPRQRQLGGAVALSRPGAIEQHDLHRTLSSHSLETAHSPPDAQCSAAVPNLCTCGGHCRCARSS